MNGCWPQLSFPICSHISRASPPIDRNQPFRPDRKGMYLMGSQKPCRSAGSARKIHWPCESSELKEDMTINITTVRICVFLVMPCAVLLVPAHHPLCVLLLCD